MSDSQPDNREKNRFFKEFVRFLDEKVLFSPISTKIIVFGFSGLKFDSRKPL